MSRTSESSLQIVADTRLSFNGWHEDMHGCCRVLPIAYRVPIKMHENLCTATAAVAEARKDEPAGTRLGSKPLLVLPFIQNLFCRVQWIKDTMVHQVSRGAVIPRSCRNRVPIRSLRRAISFYARIWHRDSVPMFHVPVAYAPGELWLSRRWWEVYRQVHGLRHELFGAFPPRQC